ncbi:hypothetical protein BC835DRAFT_1423394 [Cytidiella melzeri]|nr:hypothetical protein BC835DRAFT_1423394 [Cytidiella melzeri]
MATQTTTQSHAQTQGRGSGQRGRRGGGRGRGAGPGRGGRGRGKASSGPAQDAVVVAQDNAEEKVSNGTVVSDATAADENTNEDGDDVCFICAEPVKYYSVSACNHRTCHVCSLRLRALYKKLECTFCKEPQQSVVFTSSPDAPWSSYTPDAIPYKDGKLSIFFETQEMMEDSLVLLRFNCPESTCDYIGNGWSDLKLHTRATHGRIMCDLCIRFKKIFAHEHALYTASQLPFHLPSLQRNNRNAPPKEPVEGGVHPHCDFCRESFFGDEELYKHMREKHEECFICKRNEVKDQYFRNYDALEQHFSQGHFPCHQPVCQVRKFVVFGSALDLKAHMVEEHGADMSSRDKRDARRIQADFEFEEVGVGGRRGGRRDRGDREREREPPPSQAAGPSNAAAAGSRRRAAFGGNLTTESTNGHGPTPHAASRVQSRRQSPSPPADVDPAVAERHTAFLARVSSVATNPNHAIPAVKAAVRSYRANESAARDLISTVWTISDHNLEGTASIINGLVDILDDEDKKKDLLQAWNGFKIEQRNQFPELTPVGQGTEWAGITGGRLLNAKQTTASRSSHQSSRQVLDRVARAAASSSSSSRPAGQPTRATAPTSDRFPPLQGGPSAPPSAPAPAPAVSGFRQPQRTTPWAGSAATAAATPSSATPVYRGPTSVPGPGAKSKTGPLPSFSKSAFPELPSSATARVPKGAVGGNQSLRNILGNATPPTPVWEGGGKGSGSSTPVGEVSLGDVDGGGGGKKGKGKQKQKQTLFTLGSFPT